MKLRIYTLDFERSPRAKRWAWATMACLGLLGGGAVLAAPSVHVWGANDTLTAADLNASFAVLDQRLAAAEAKEPFAGTFPAVRGAGLPPVWCGPAPTTIVVAPAVPTTGAAYSNGFGEVLFTNGGAVGIDESLTAATSTCTTSVCASPVTYYLKSPVDQTITIHAYLDDTGAVYVNGMQRAVTSAAAPIALSYNATANTPFSVSFMGCSTNGATIGFTVNDPFITTYGLQVDYDATFHRNGK